MNLSIFAKLDLSQINHLAGTKSAKTGNIHILYGTHQQLAFAAICVAEAFTAIYTGYLRYFAVFHPVTRLTKIAFWDGDTRVNAVFVHGLGGDATGTWQRHGDDTTFWPAWLSRDIPGLTAWTLAYDAPPSRWFNRAKAGMALQDRAGNVLEYLLGQPELKGRPLIFICHSLGGLVVKQVIRAADGRRGYSTVAAAFLDSVKGVVFIATPHTGSLHATLLDRLRLVAWPSPSALDLVKNNANLRNLNVWYRNNWSLRIRHKVFYEKHRTTAGVVVADDSADPGLLHVDPVAVDADHIGICKPADKGDVVYARTRDFIVDEILSGAPPFPPELLSAATVEQIVAAVRAKSPGLTAEQIDQFIHALRELRGDPSFGQAVEQAKKGNTRVAEGIWLQIYENRKKEKHQAQREQAEAARNLAASAIVSDVVQGLRWYREATSLDPDNMTGWLGLGDAAMEAGVLREADQGFLTYIELARRTGDERELAVGSVRHGDVLVAQGNLPAALKRFRDGHDIFKGLAQADPGNAGWQRDLSVSYNKIGDVLVAQGNLPEALKSFRDGLSIAEQLARADPGNAGWQRDLSVSFDRVGDVLVAQGNLPEALKSFRDGLSIRDRLAQADPGNAGWQRDLSVSYNKIGDVLVAQGNLPEALKSFRDGLSIAEQLAQADPGNAGWQRDLAISHERMGDMERRLDRPAEARTAFERALAIYDALLTTNPENTVFLVSSTVPLMRQGELDPARREACFRRALKILKDLDAAGRLEYGRKGAITWLESQLGH